MTAARGAGSRPSRRGEVGWWALLVAGGLVLVLAWAGRREATRTAWAGLAVVSALLAALAAVGFASGSVAVGAVYLGFAAAMGTGLALASVAR